MIGEPETRPVVVHAIHAAPARTETFIQNQVVSLRRHRPLVVCHHRRPDSELLPNEGVEVTDVLGGPLARLDALAYRYARQTLPPATAALARHVRGRDARLLHYHYLTDARFFLGLRRRTGLPAVVSAYGYDVTVFPGKYRGLGRRYLSPIFAELDLFLAMSELMRRDLLAVGCPEHKIRVHYHGIDTARFAYPDRRYGEEPVATVLVCATLNRIKSQHLVLRALGELDSRGVTAFRLVLVGEGETRDELERLVDELGLRGRVRFAGHLAHGSDELPRVYREATVFALTSTTLADGGKEGIPGVIVEAMSSGLPVVATRHGGIPTVVRDGVTGLLVPENDVRALADAFERLLGDASLRESLGRTAAATARRELDLRPATEALEDIYDELITGRQGSAGRD